MGRDFLFEGNRYINHPCNCFKFSRHHVQYIDPEKEPSDKSNRYLVGRFSHQR
jgi:hypothetical protein